MSKFYNKWIMIKFFKNRIEAAKEIKIYIFILSALFVASFLQGYAAAAQNQKEAEEILRQLFSEFEFIGELSSLEIFLFIFLNNSLKALLAIILGFFFGLVPLFFVLFNGQIIGIVVYVAGLETGAAAVILSLMPHGIFEIPVFIISSGYGLWLGVKFYRKLFHKEPFRIYFQKAIGEFFKILLPLFLLAAFIEVFLTAHLAG